MSFYAVRRGRKPGVYTTWEDAQEQIDAYPGAHYSKCKSMEEAIEFMASGMKLVKLVDRADVVFKPRIKSPVMQEQEHTDESDNLVSYFKGFKEMMRDSESEPKPAPETLDHLVTQYHALRCPDETTVHIYTDGSTFGNGKHWAYGGYGMFLCNGDKTVIRHYPLPRKHGTKVSSGVAELCAIIEALRHCIDITTKTILHYDSEYAAKVVQGINQAHTNVELVKEAQTLLCQCPHVTFKHIKAHTDLQELHSIGNKIADKLAAMGSTMAKKI